MVATSVNTALAEVVDADTCVDAALLRDAIVVVPARSFTTVDEACAVPVESAATTEVVKTKFAEATLKFALLDID